MGSIHHTEVADCFPYLGFAAVFTISHKLHNVIYIVIKYDFQININDTENNKLQPTEKKNEPQ